MFLNHECGELRPSLTVGLLTQSLDYSSFFNCSRIESSLERQVIPIAHDCLLTVAAEDVAQEFFHFWIDWLARRPIDESGYETRQWIVALDEIFFCGFVIMVRYPWLRARAA